MALPVSITREREKEGDREREEERGKAEETQQLWDCATALCYLRANLNLQEGVHENISSLMLLACADAYTRYMYFNLCAFIG